MQIWVDADACPNVIKEILFRVANRVGIMVTLVANHHVRVPPSPHIRSTQVPAGFDVADNYIAQEAVAGDLLITQDIPLAAEVMDNKVDVINNRGETYNPQTIRQKLQMRDFMETLRSSGVQSGGPAAFSDKDKQTFANSLDRWLARAKRGA